jgi:hypothetical protein
MAQPASTSTLVPSEETPVTAFLNTQVTNLPEDPLRLNVAMWPSPDTPRGTPRGLPRGPPGGPSAGPHGGPPGSPASTQGRFLGVNASRQNRELRINEPESFNGKSGNFRKFLHQCTLYLQINRQIYDDDDKKIAFVLSYMTKGPAQVWAENFLAEHIKEEGTYIFPNYG